MTDPARVGVLLSGRGSNYQALQRSVDEGLLPAEIVVVISNHRGAKGLDTARRAGVTAKAIPSSGMPREKHERCVIAELRAFEVEWVCLAGYMRLLTATFVDAFPHRILNIHPSLLPAFPGLNVQAAALEHGVRVSGCTVHLVDRGLDSGPIVVQRAVDVLDDDDEDSLSARILREEHVAYSAALRRLLTEPWRVEGRAVRFS